jgi:hypothetical protein
VARSIRRVGDPRRVRRAKRWTPDATELQMLTEHLFYDVQMTFFLAAQLDTPTGSRMDISLRNAQIEALTLHLRQLCIFFWGDGKRDRSERDAFAADYFADGEWPRLRPELPAILEKAVADPDAGVAQLSYSRTWVRPADKVWDAVSQAFALAAIVKRFADTVDHGQFTPGYVNGMKICAEMFLKGVSAHVAA